VTGAKVESVAKTPEGFLVRAGEQAWLARAVIIATGGLSMRRTGSTGDGFRFAEELGHTVAPLRPSLVPLVTKETWPREVAGLSLRNVTLTARTARGRIKRFGEMLFTHHGIGGPITLEVSRFLTDVLHAGEGPVPVWIDLKPALDEKKLDARLLREIEGHPHRKTPALLRTLMPGSLADVFVSRFGFDPERESNAISREERTRLRVLLKELPLTVTATEPMEAALVTRGGVSTREIDPRTMESRLVPGLFFAGEVIDVDGDTGGYNLQMCWSTGSLAGASAGKKQD
jgi:predicted Rossmann fold flavoprotein